MTVFTFLSSYDSDGVPSNINIDPSNNDDIKYAFSQSLIDEININLPGGTPVSETKKDWIRKSDIDLIATAEAKVTFLHEGAGYKNVLAYYVYETGSAPNRFSDIEEIVIVFPNTSLPGSGGNLNSGDTVKIPYSIDTVTTENINGRNVRVADSVTWEFPEGYSIGWVCMADRWKGSYVSTNHMMYSSDPNLNPETDVDLRCHSVNYKSQVDPTEIIYGFEDIHRERSWCDQDFNDLTYCVHVTPGSAVDPSSVNSTTKQEFKGIMICEDLYNSGSKADYDYNDLTLKYHVTEVIDSFEKIQSITIKLEAQTRGASLNHNFGVVIPNIKSQENCVILRETNVVSTGTITRENLTSSILGGSTDRIPCITDTKSFLPSGAIWATNTVDGSTMVESSWSTLKISFTNGGVDRSVLNNAYFPYNFYLEVYKYNANNAPVNYFLYSDNNYSDVSAESLEAGITEKKKIFILENLNNFQVPIEKQPIRYVYHKFTKFMQGHKKFRGWYRKKAWRREHLLYPKVKYTDDHDWDPLIENEWHEDNFVLVDLKFEHKDNSTITTWDGNDQDTIDTIEKYSKDISEIGDWTNDDFKTVANSQKMIELLTKVGTPIHITNNGFFDELVSDKFLCVSLDSFATAGTLLDSYSSLQLLAVDSPVSNYTVLVF